MVQEQHQLVEAFKRKTKKLFQETISEIMMLAEIERPEISDPLYSSKLLWFKDSWMREKGKDLGIKAEKMIRGGILASIIGDDSNFFSWDKQGVVFDRRIAIMAKGNILYRLVWEYRSPETPDEIKEKAKEVFSQLVGSDFSVREEYERAKAIWWPFRDWVAGRVKKCPEYAEAIAYEMKIQKDKKKFGIQEKFRQYLSAEGKI